MKTLKSLVSLLSLALIISMVAMSCEENPEFVQQDNFLPESFGVDIPSSISNPNLVSGGRISGRTEEELKGDDIYRHLGLFIAIGEGAADIVQHIILGIKFYNIESVQTLTFTSDDDNRVKNLIVTEGDDFEGITWEYSLTITDADSEGNDDGGKAMQVFWNNNPIEGIAIIKPYNLNRSENAQQEEAVYRVDYTQDSDLGYDEHMEVSISGLSLNLADRFSMRTLKMFAGRKDDVVDVYGNSSHPDAWIFNNTDPGFNWAFVASGSHNEQIGTAEVGLPPSLLDSNERGVLLDDYSIKNVFENEIRELFPNITQNLLDAYLVNTNPPGYFDDGGFLSAGVSPGTGWDSYAERLEDLTPYNPKTTTELVIEFK